MNDFKMVYIMPSSSLILAYIYSACLNHNVYNIKYGLKLEFLRGQVRIGEYFLHYGDNDIFYNSTYYKNYNFLKSDWFIQHSIFP